MLLVMTFQLPYGFLAGINVMFFSRENPQATLRSAIRSILMYTTATAYTIVSIAMLGGEPIIHFLWIALSIFLGFYAIRVINDYFVAVGFGFMAAFAIPLWDENLLNVNTRVENTLWILGAVVLSGVVTVIVEFMFRSFHPATNLHIAITARLEALQDLLRQIAANEPVSDKVNKTITLYSNLGMSRTRRGLVISGYSPQFAAEMNAAIALLGRLVDLAASLQIVSASHPISLNDADRERCLALAGRLAGLEHDLRIDRPPQLIDIPAQPQPSRMPFLPEMERTVALITQVFSSRSSSLDIPIPPADDDAPQPLFVPDMFSNPEHLKFAIRGTLATMLAYVVYQSVNWTGLSTAIPTCIITALSTIGASRQKQQLRLGGVIMGGVVFGMGSQVFLLPHFNSIASFAVLFAIVVFIAAWIQTATPRLSYLGVQLALGFFLINLQEFTIQSSLAVARDRVCGTLLALLCMWLVFDHLWVRSALQEMEDAFARNLRLLAELMEQSCAPDPKHGIGRIAQLRDQINAGFNTVRAQSDAVLFEFGPSRPYKLHMRDNFRRWQPMLATLLQVQITYAQYLLLVKLAEPVMKAHRAFQADVIHVARAISDEIGGRICGPTPDLRESAAKLRIEIQNDYQAAGVPLPVRASDVLTLTENLASILMPLYQDVQATFAKGPPELARPDAELRNADGTA